MDIKKTLKCIDEATQLIKHLEDEIERTVLEFVVFKIIDGREYKKRMGYLTLSMKRVVNALNETNEVLRDHIKNLY